MNSLLEKDNVVDVYSEIAHHFSETRANQWSWITEFINNVSKCSSQNNIKNILDIGCGNGRNMYGFKNCKVYGIDNCIEFIKICHSKGLTNVIYSDMTIIPFPDNYFNFLMSIASFHHLSTEKRRIKALHEYHRISDSNSKLIMSVWSIRQPPNTKQYKNIKKYGDTIIEWNKYGKTYDRYYYIFKVEELMTLFQITNWIVEKHFWDYGNEVFILNKKLNNT